jgi:hypothetical protein
LSIVFLVDENPNVASAGLGGVVVGGARSVPDRAARSNSERAAPSACVGKRFRLSDWKLNVFEYESRVTFIKPGGPLWPSDFQQLIEVKQLLGGIPSDCLYQKITSVENQT